MLFTTAMMTLEVITHIVGISRLFAKNCSEYHRFLPEINKQKVNTARTVIL